jgi:hypothetical protein
LIGAREIARAFTTRLRVVGDNRAARARARDFFILRGQIDYLTVLGSDRSGNSGGVVGWWHSRLVARGLARGNIVDSVGRDIMIG